MKNRLRADFFVCILLVPHRLSSDDAFTFAQTLFTNPIDVSSSLDTIQDFNIDWALSKYVRLSLSKSLYFPLFNGCLAFVGVLHRQTEKTLIKVTLRSDQSPQ